MRSTKSLFSFNLRQMRQLFQFSLTCAGARIHEDYTEHPSHLSQVRFRRSEVAGPSTDGRLSGGAETPIFHALQIKNNLGSTPWH